uniref:Phosphatase 2C family protein n=1 Tax=Rhizophora mucronata TaxID=61149 RepID=A0A2P2L8J1_RHIMU
MFVVCLTCSLEGKRSCSLSFALNEQDYKTNRRTNGKRSNYFMVILGYG